MPKLVYKPSRDLPLAVRTLKTFSPTKIREWILNRFNEDVTPESITMWFKRHPDIKEQLEKELTEEAKNKVIVDQAIFEKFEEIESVRAWVEEMKDRMCSEKYIRSSVITLKQICMGRFPKLGIDLVQEGLWTYKHPDRLTLDDVRELIRILRDRNIETHRVRIVARNFLLSKGIIVGKKISGAKSKGFGKFSRLYVEIDILQKMLEWIKERDFEVYVIDRFMFNTGTRITATLNARIEDLKVFETHAEITVFDKARRSMYPNGKPWIKYIPLSLYDEMKKIIGDRKVGKIFTKKEGEVAKLNKEAIQLFAPEVWKEYGDRVMPNHFWRHMFAQHMLRATNWNYTLVAELGGWTPQALYESYGKPPMAIVAEWGLKFMPNW
ncbi:MAG: tyrosine-type recombinase/integrase [Nitrososphaerota archaeon]